MPNLKLTNLSSLKAYFADIASKHNDIHDFKWGDKDVARNDNRSDLQDGFLWAERYDKVRYSDLGSDNVNKLKPARISYLKTADSELFADQDAGFDFCESVIEDIIARILRDKRGSQVDGQWQMLASRISSITTGPVEVKLGSTRYLGWEMMIEFFDNTNLVYNASKWND